MMSQATKIPTIGVIGGGQLGKMLIQKAMQWSVPIIILDKDKDCVSAIYAHHHIIKDIKSVEGLDELAAQSDVITYEIEHTNTQKLIELEEAGKIIIPSPRALEIIQDKGKQKLFYQTHKIPTADFFIAENKTELLEKLQDFNSEKVVVKSCIGGYDGKGVYIDTRKNIIENVNVIPFDDAVMVEKFVPCKAEIAVLAAQDTFGNIEIYPAIEMEFDKQSNLVSYLHTPANIPIYIEEKAKEIAKQCLKAFNSAGLFAIEFFLSEDLDLLVNEIAPRPHNSAHHTIEGFYTSQYEQLLRILLKLPLGKTEFKMPCAMLNIVAGNNQEGTYILPYIKELSSMKGVYVHLYGKKIAKPNRKLGHITICLPTKEEVLNTANLVRNLLSIEIIE
jgi:5-(carboxyamino)imidazole ribonucleotide synthase